jgi:hypothetical protein
MTPPLACARCGHLSHIWVFGKQQRTHPRKGGCLYPTVGPRCSCPALVPLAPKKEGQ